MTTSIIKSNLPAILRREFASSPFVSLDNFFEEALRSFPTVNIPTVSALAKSSYPKVNIVEEKDKVIINAAIPGLAKEDINIDIEEDVLTISGSKQEEECTDADCDINYLKREIHKSSFRRGWILNDNLDQDNITAEAKDGILSIIIPKLEPEVKEVKKVEIK